MDEKPKRRWFRFSLRTLFVVMTLFAVYLGWQARIVRERKALIAEGEARGLWRVTVTTPRWSVRSLMGDQRIEYVDVETVMSLDDATRLENAFPEATGRMIILDDKGNLLGTRYCSSILVLLEQYFLREQKTNELTTP